jgi:hypothetical protein
MVLSWFSRATRQPVRNHRRQGASRRRARLRLGVELLEARCLLSCDPLSPYRTIDGTCNNLANPNWGSASDPTVGRFTDLLREAPTAYGDGIGSPAGASRPGARLISNQIFAQTVDVPNSRNLSDYSYVWGQFIDHDMTRVPTDLSNPFNIPVPTGDPIFDPKGTGTATIPVNRSQFDPATGTDPSNPRQQFNILTAFLDGSQVYGSSAVLADFLRTHVGGKLLTGSGNLLPTAQHNVFLSDGSFFQAGTFIAGDVRVNENIDLTSLHTLFMREHNRVADQIAATQFAGQNLSDPAVDEAIYQQARKMVGAEIEAITYNEFLPALLGPNALPPYMGYNPSVNPGISNEFTAVAFRVGHTLVDSTVEQVKNDGSIIGPKLQLRDTFSRPSLMTNQRDPGLFLKGMATGTAQEVDPLLVDDIRNFLPAGPGGATIDLGATDIQRFRDHGGADYNTLRQAFGLPAVGSFADITSDMTLQGKLQAFYGNVNNIDAFVGGLAEAHVAGGSLGPLFRAIWIDQFTRLRDGDRFFFENPGVFSASDLATLENTQLSDIIRRNTQISNIQDNVFFAQTTDASTTTSTTTAAVVNAVLTPTSAGVLPVLLASSGPIGPTGWATVGQTPAPATGGAAVGASLAAGAIQQSVPGRNMQATANSSGRASPQGVVDDVFAGIVDDSIAKL